MTGEIVAADLPTKDVDDASQVGSLLGQLANPIASFTGDGAYDQAGVYRAVADHQPEAAVIVSPRITAVFSATAAIEPTQRRREGATLAALAQSYNISRATISRLRG